MDGQKQLNYYRLDPTDVIDQLRSNEKGLTSEEARERLQHIGPNELKHAKRESIVFTFLKQFKNALIIILLTTAVISAYLQDNRTAIVLLAIAFINAFIGFFQ